MTYDLFSFLFAILFSIPWYSFNMQKDIYDICYTLLTVAVFSIGSFNNNKYKLCLRVTKLNMVIFSERFEVALDGCSCHDNTCSTYLGSPVKLTSPSARSRKDYPVF